MTGSITVAVGLAVALGASGGEIAIGHFGDSTAATTYLPEEQRVHVLLKKRLEETFNRLEVKSHNLAKDGDFIYRFLNQKEDWGPKWKEGEGPKPGRYYREVKGKVQTLDVAFVRYGQNDMKQYDTKEFEKQLNLLIDTLQRDFSGVLVVLETGTFFDPEHYTWAGINKRFDEYWDIVRKVAVERRLPLIDVFRKWEEETRKGNWDLRIRRDGTIDASKDKEHEGDIRWFANGHPNLNGVKVIVREEFELLSGLLKGRRRSTAS
jgi:hypothetical protein